MAKDGDLRRLFKANIKSCQWTTIESPLGGSGIPDAEGCLRGGYTFWIEFKKIDKPTHKIRHMKPGQIAWLEQRIRYGGRAFISVRVTDAADTLHLFLGTAARYLFDSGIPGVPPNFIMGEWSGGSGKWDWPAVAKCLEGK